MADPGFWDSYVQASLSNDAAPHLPPLRLMDPDPSPRSGQVQRFVPRSRLSERPFLGGSPEPVQSALNRRYTFMYG